MAKVYVATAYSDAEGEHAIGDELDIPNGTPQEKLLYDRLLRYGIISEQLPEGAPVAPTEPKGRAKRRS